MDKCIVTAMTLGILLFIGILPTMSATPSMINYQGFLTDSEGQPLSGIYVMTFIIYDGQTTPESDSLWGEMLTLETTNGLFNVLLGSYNPLTDNIFSDTGRYLGIRIGGPTEPEISPRTPLVSAPYAFRVQTVDGATGGDIFGNLQLHSILKVGDGAGDAGYVQIFNGADQTVQISGKDASDNGALLRLDNSNDDATIILDADDFQAGDVGGALRLADGVVDTTVTMDAWDIGGGAIITMGNSEGDATIILDARDAQEPGDVGARVTLLNGSSEAIILNAIDVNASGAQFIMIGGNGNDTTVSIYSNGDANDWGAIIRLYDGDGNKTVHLDANSGTDGGAFFAMYDADGDKTVHLDASGTGGAQGGAQLSLCDSSGATTISLDAQSGSAGGAHISLVNGTGTGTIQLDADYGGTGEGRVITSVLEITGGADLSEHFDVRHLPGGGQPIPGMLVCIDSENPGALTVSDKAYDPTVAGIISGAGGIKPGMLMGQAGSVSDGQYAVALTGRVYCLADAMYGKIKPGDLLTTSDTPGHAMKATDYAKAQGAIIGKAMSSLQDGKGIVLVLVSLQ